MREKEDDFEVQLSASRVENHSLKRQNELLKEQFSQLQHRRKLTEKQLGHYKKMVFEGQDKGELFEMQHRRIFQLETQLGILQSKYKKLFKDVGSKAETQYALRCKQLEAKLKEQEDKHQKEIAAMKQKIIEMNASQILGSRVVNLGTEIKKNQTSGNKFV